MRVILILVDGMRPDAIENNERLKNILKRSTYTMDAQTVMPAVTLPCHVSLFHSTDPARHGTTTNDYTPQVRPIRGLCEVLKAAGKKCAFFYVWEQLRDISRPGSLDYSFYQSSSVGGAEADRLVTREAIEYLSKRHVDFTFLYLMDPDTAGHNVGWMTEEYFASVENSLECIETVLDSLPDDYRVIITADHGGHDRWHGMDIKEDMTIPLIMMGEEFEMGKVMDEEVNIKDIAPTVTRLFGIEADGDWEGKSLI